MVCVCACLWVGGPVGVFWGAGETAWAGGFNLPCSYSLHDLVSIVCTLCAAAFGFSIIKTLVTDIEPAAKVKAAMNEINAAQRLRWACYSTCWGFSTWGWVRI